jgi:hypothetical protein
VLLPLGALRRGAETEGDVGSLLHASVASPLATSRRAAVVVATGRVIRLLFGSGCAYVSTCEECEGATLNVIVRPA